MAVWMRRDIVWMRRDIVWMRRDIVTYPGSLLHVGSEWQVAGGKLIHVVILSQLTRVVLKQQ